MSKKTAQGFTTNLTVKHGFHEKLDGETRVAVVSGRMDSLNDDFSLGFLIGLLVGEGHFGGDGRQPQITLRMHVKHEKLFRWLERTIPQGKLYGPYTHGGRSYFQWMIRGEPLRGMLVPLIVERLDWLDDHVAARFLTMCERYGIPINRA